MGALKEYYTKFILYMAVIVLINIVGITLFFRIDLTENRIFSLSQASKEVVSTLSDPLSIKVFFSKNLPAPYNNNEQYLRDLLEEYAAFAGKYFNYTFYNVSSDEGNFTANTDKNREMAQSYGIFPVQIQIMENDEIKFQNAYMGMAIIHGDLTEKIETISSIEDLEYTLTTAIQKMNNKVSTLLRLQEKVKAKLYLSSSLNNIASFIGIDKLPDLLKTIESTVDNLNKKNLNVIEFEHIDLKKEFDSVAEKYNMMTLSWPAIPSKNIIAGQGLASLVIEYQNEFQSIPLISAIELPIFGTTYQMIDSNDLDERITILIEKMIGINQNIGYLADHGTPSLGFDQVAMMQQDLSDQTLSTFNSLISSRYHIRPVFLKNDVIPEGLNCLIIVKPTEKFTDYELFQIDQALMKGMNIAFFGDIFKLTPPQYSPIDTNLEKLFQHYGILMEQGYVLDKSAYQYQIPTSQGGGEQLIYFAPVLKENSINHELEFMKNIKMLVGMQCSPLTIDLRKQHTENIKATCLLKSSNESWLMQDIINLNPTLILPPTEKDKFKSYALAYILEGKFSSYFKEKPIPAKTIVDKDVVEKKDVTMTNNREKNERRAKDLKTENRVIDSSNAIKIFFLGSSQMIQDNMLDINCRSTNTTFILNVIDHLNDQDKIAVLRSKQQTFNPINQTTPFIRGFIKSFNIAVLPLLVILFGLGVFVKRNARKRKIYKMFNEY